MGCRGQDGDPAGLGSHSLSTDLRCIRGQHPCGAPVSSKPGSFGRRQRRRRCPLALCLCRCCPGLAAPAWQGGIPVPAFHRLRCLAPAKRSEGAGPCSALRHPSLCQPTWESVPAAGYSRAALHLQRADVVKATLHDVGTGRRELHPLALEVFLVIHGDLEWRASCRVGNCPAAAPGDSASLRDGRSRSVRGRAGGGCTRDPSGLGRSPARLCASLHCWPALPCPGVVLGPAPLSCSPLRRSVPRAAVPSGERSGAVLGWAGGRAVAGGSPGLCSERSRAKRINGGKGEGGSPGGLRLMLCSPATAPGFMGVLPTCTCASPLPLGSRLKPCPRSSCQSPQGCSPPCSAVPTTRFAAPLPTLPACLR